MYLNVVLSVTFYTFVNLIFKLIGIASMCIEMISENAQYSFIKLFYITFWTHILWCKNFFFFGMLFISRQMYFTTTPRQMYFTTTPRQMYFTTTPEVFK